MTIRLSSRVASRLHALACDEITRSHVDALNEITSKKINASQWEAKFVAHLCRAMADVAKAWGGELATAKTGAPIAVENISAVRRGSGMIVRGIDPIPLPTIPLTNRWLKVSIRVQGTVEPKNGS